MIVWLYTLVPDAEIRVYSLTMLTEEIKLAFIKNGVVSGENQREIPRFGVLSKALARMGNFS